VCQASYLQCARVVIVGHIAVALVGSSQIGHPRSHQGLGEHAGFICKRRPTAYAAAWNTTAYRLPVATSAKTFMIPLLRVTKPNIAFPPATLKSVFGNVSIQERSMAGSESSNCIDDINDGFIF